MYFKVEYVVQAVNPATLNEFAKKEAVLNTKRDMRHCLTKLAIRQLEGEKVSKADMLSCAD